MEKASYKNEVEEPKVAPKGHPESGMGCHEFKKQAHNIAYGQAGETGCKADMKKFSSQMKHYDWEGSADH